MRPKSGAFSRYRPRVLTFIVLFAVAAPTVLANLIPTDVVQSGYARNDFEYGWPLIWFWRNLAAKAGGTQFEWRVLRYSWPRFAGNLAIWSVMLAVAVTASEWLVRRYRPRLRWSLRTMLAAIGILAVVCAWGAMLRERANVQDVLIAAIEQQHGGVYLKRWGPDWLDLVGADRFRRRIIGVKLWRYGEIEDFLKRIGRLPDLRHLDLEAGEWTPGMSAALADMRQLRSLRIAVKADERNSDEVLAAIGKLNQLKVLSLSDMIIASDNLSRLA
ncbi:MAG TPA: hypothetical protein VGX78_19370, partial [Pirellulales bacterium]|nr:hypothetical protein [Pirellulales bacterium]